MPSISESVDRAKDVLGREGVRCELGECAHQEFGTESHPASRITLIDDMLGTARAEGWPEREGAHGSHVAVDEEGTAGPPESEARHGKDKRCEETGR